MIFALLNKSQGMLYEVYRAIIFSSTSKDQFFIFFLFPQAARRKVGKRRAAAMQKEAENNLRQYHRVRTSLWFFFNVWFFFSNEKQDFIYSSNVMESYPSI